MPEAGIPEGEESPFLPPAIPRNEAPATTDPSVFAEPWMQATIHVGVPGDPPDIDRSVLPSQDEENTVWDEPGLSRSLAGAMPEGAFTWFGHYRKKLAETTVLQSWLTTGLVAFLAGPLAILGTLIQGAASSGLVMLVAIGPTAEEIMKTALPVWIVEKRPWLFRSPTQILVCCFASGIMFAAVENVVYLKLYIADPTPGLAQWRWTVCVLLHSFCSLTAGIGVVRMWKRFQSVQSRPDIADAAGAIATAIVLHGTYNATVTMLELGGVSF